MTKKDKGTKKKNNKLKYFIIFILFIGIGIGLGVFGTTKFLEYKNDNNNEPVVEEGPMDITESDKYQDTINNLRNILNGNPIFYSTKGINASSLDNTTRLNLIYEYIINNNMATVETLPIDYIGATTCNNNVFTVDTTLGDGTVSNICTINKVSKATFLDINMQLFNDEVLDTSVNFNVGIDKKCVLSNDMYLCGNTVNMSGYTGELESKFNVVKVTKDESNTIVIYEKGYLIDGRSNVDNPTDQYENYYLHSSDSKDYYYELKSADNLTFKHVFKTDDKEKYYYVSSELVKE